LFFVRDPAHAAGWRRQHVDGENAVVDGDAAGQGSHLGVARVGPGPAVPFCRAMRRGDGGAVDLLPQLALDRRGALDRVLPGAIDKLLVGQQIFGRDVLEDLAQELGLAEDFVGVLRSRVGRRGLVGIIVGGRLAREELVGPAAEDLTPLLLLFLFLDTAPTVTLHLVDRKGRVGGRGHRCCSLV